MGKFNLLDWKFDLTQSGEMAFGRSFQLRLWQEISFERERITPYAIGLIIKEKVFFHKLLQGKTLVLSQITR